MQASLEGCLVRKNIPPDHKSISISLKILINLTTFLCLQDCVLFFRKFSRFLALSIKI